MANIKNKRKCPYCGRKIKYTSSFFSMRSGEYTCGNCGKYCNIKFSSNIYILLCVAIVVSVLIGIIIFKGTFKGIIFSFIPFMILYFIIPLFINFETPTFISEERKAKQKKV